MARKKEAEYSDQHMCPIVLPTHYTHSLLCQLCQRVFLWWNGCRGDCFCQLRRSLRGHVLQRCIMLVSRGDKML